MRAMTSNHFKFTSLPDPSRLMGRRVDSPEIFGMSKNIYPEVKFLGTNCKRLSLIRSHAVNITRLAEMDGLLEEWKLLSQRITSCSCDVVLQENLLKEAA